LAPLRGGIELIHALDGSKVSVNGFGVCPGLTERSRRLFDLRFVGCDQEVVAFLCALCAALRQF
jgi:hypothetical protein